MSTQPPWPGLKRPVGSSRHPDSSLPSLLTGLVPGLLLVALLGLLAACGGSPSAPAAGPGTPTESGASAVPTMPAARFTAVAQTAFTGTVPITATVTATETVASADLERGARIYANRQCGDCHGAQGEGVPGKGSALAGLTLSEEEFTDILRTGGNGSLGPDHLYGPNAISPSGMQALYQWLRSLPAE
ncbi:cytochrome c [Litorilinea aerophila]|nr:cytochrome c [Litorilinea aerophila]MCC9077024.1 cytochrome c [Litorilinea aerophila]